jgi:flagellar basal-body rod protein FlgB
MKIFDQTLNTLERSLDVRLLRHNALAGNLANADTPNFLPQDIDFQAAMATQNSSPFSTGSSSPSTISLAPPNQTLAPIIPLDSPRPGLPALAHSGANGQFLVEAQGVKPGFDGNGVDLDRTMASLAQNALQYGACARAAGKKLAILRYVASDGVA